MQTISYKQACEILGVKYVTIKDAVLYGRLTKCAGITGSLLLREQVELFKNKKISPNSLTLEEKKLWEEYKNIAENAELLKLAVQGTTQAESIIADMVRQIQSKGDQYVVITRENGMQESHRLMKEILISIKVLDQGEIELSYPR